MTSSELGLDIKKTLLSKTTLGKAFGVDKTLQKAAKNYLLLGKISHNLNIINQNIINLVRAFGIEAREKEDAHYLKQNEREINFRVRRDKYIDSKVKKVDPDGDSSGGSGLLGWFARKRIKKFVRKITTRVMLKLRRNQYFKSLVKIINKFKKQIRDFFKQFDFKKIIVNWWKEKGEPFIKELFDKSKNLFEKLGPLFKRAFPKLTARLVAIFAGSLATGPLAPFVAIILTAGFAIYDGIMGAIEETSQGGSGFVGFFSGIIEGITFGLFDRKLIADKMYEVNNFFENVYLKIRGVVKSSVDFIVEKFNNIITPIFNETKKNFDFSNKQSEYDKQVEEFQKKYEEEQKLLDEVLKKEREYVTKLANNNRKKFEVKRRLIDEINILQKEENEAEQKIAAAEGRKPPQKVPPLSKAEREDRRPRKIPPEAPVVTAPPPVAAPAPVIKPPVTPTPVKEAPTAKPTGVSSDGTFNDVNSFVKALKPWAEYVSQKLGGKIPPLAILGQWAGESGSGKNLPANFNYAGIKAGKTYEKGDYVLTEERYTDAQIKRAEAAGESLEKVITSPDDKIKKKGRMVTIDEWFGKGAWQKAKDEGKNWVQVRSYFAKFKDIKDFADSFAGFISSPRYAKAREQTTAAGFGYEIAKAGYATASAEKYSQKVEAFEKQFKGIGGEGTGPLSNSFTAIEPETGKKIIYDSKEMFLGHREQKKPTDFDVVNVTQIENTKLFKKTAKKDVEKIDSVNILLNRVA